MARSPGPSCVVDRRTANSLRGAPHCDSLSQPGKRRRLIRTSEGALHYRGGVDIDALIARLAARATGTRTEADVQSDVKLLLLGGQLDLREEDVSAFEVALEASAGAGRRIDVAAGLAVIEVKKDLRPERIRVDAVKQLAGYVKYRTEVMEQRYVGILTDGHDWYLYALTSDGELQQADYLEVRAVDDGPRLLGWLSAILSTNDRVQATRTEVDRRLGAESPAHEVDMIALRELYNTHSLDGELRLKKELWGKLLRTAFGENAEDDAELFLRHTYLVITSELIAHEVIGVDITNLSAGDLVTGRAFRDAGVYGVVESDFFDWPAEFPGGEQIIQAIARRVARIDWSTTEHDILKHLYESVISAEQRHSLGEYYTPDWLAEAVVEEVVDNPAQQRVLDPACGSGTFLFHSVRRTVASLEAAGYSNRDALARVTGLVLGMDVHPVAVTLARVTYLLAIGAERLGAERDELSIPVYLGDSVQWQIDHSVLGEDGLTIPTSDGHDLFAAELFFPASVLDDPTRFDRLVAELVDKATNRKRGQRPFPGIAAILRGFALSETDRAALTRTFELLCDLHDHHRNHIWGYYVRNLARPRWLTTSEAKVDRIIGNPPWLSYRFMDATMQRVFRDRSKSRNIWAGGNVATHQDLAPYFLVRSCELYLRDGGSFGVVMPLAVLSRKHTEGFRKGVWGSAGTARFTGGWDLDKVRPHIFPVPSSVVLGTFRTVDAEQDASPLVTTERWSGRTSGSRWAETKSALDRATVTAGAVNAGVASPYARDFIQGATIVPRVLHVVEQVEAVGALGLPAGVVNVRSVRSSLEKGVWKTLPSRGPVAVETACVHPMHLGSTLLPFRMVKPWHIVLPIDPASGELMDLGSTSLDAFPRTREWWDESCKLWNGHGKGVLTLRERVDYMRGLSRQVPAPATRLAYTKSGSRLAAAVITDPTAVIDHKLYWAPMSSVNEARYLEAVLNAELTQRLVEPYQSRGLMGARDFDMYVWRLSIPRFDPTEKLHLELVRLGEEAEGVAAGVNVDDVGFQAARGRVRAALNESGIAVQMEEAVASLLVGLR